MRPSEAAPMPASGSDLSLATAQAQSLSAVRLHRRPVCSARSSPQLLPQPDTPPTLQAAANGHGSPVAADVPVHAGSPLGQVAASPRSFTSPGLQFDKCVPPASVDSDLSQSFFKLGDVTRQPHVSTSNLLPSVHEGRLLAAEAHQHANMDAGQDPAWLGKVWGFTESSYGSQLTQQPSSMVTSETLLDGGLAAQFQLTAGWDPSVQLAGSISNSGSIMRPSAGSSVRQSPASNKPGRRLPSSSLRSFLIGGEPKSIPSASADYSNSLDPKVATASPRRSLHTQGARLPADSASSSRTPGGGYQRSATNNCNGATSSPSSGRMPRNSGWGASTTTADAPGASYFFDKLRAMEGSDTEWMADNSSRETQVLTAWQRLLYSMHSASATIYSRPSVLLGPLLVLCLLIALGIYGVMSAARDFEHQARFVAADGVAQGIATTLQLRLEASLIPTRAMETLVQRGPRMEDLVPKFRWFGAAAQSWGGTDAAIFSQLQLLPQGVVRLMYPKDIPSIMGLDVLRHPLRREGALSTIASGQVQLKGPYNLFEGGQGLVSYYPVFIQNATKGDTWGWPDVAYNCSICFLEGTNTSFWGFVSTITTLTAFNEGPGTEFSKVRKQGYLYQLVKPDDNHPGALVTIAQSDPPPSLRMKPVQRDVEIAGGLWVLQLERDGGWRPYWQAPCLAGVVLGSLVLSLLLLMVMLGKQRQHCLLLQMLPAKAVKRLQSGQVVFVEQFKSATILFSDIVSYTNMAALMSPLQVIELLDEVYSLFDTLTQQYGVYKVQTIGDSIMCVSGCPEAEAPEAAAARMAHMAMDMIRAVEGFVSTRGQQIQIRIGLHSGPVSAGVIGRRMPRYCVFGDAVNIASRMESTSQPMRIHVSAATAQLLQQAMLAASPATCPNLNCCDPCPDALDGTVGTLEGLAHMHVRGPSALTLNGHERLMFNIAQDNSVGPGPGGDALPEHVDSNMDASRTQIQIGLQPKVEFDLQSRGEVDVKGKGRMATFWLRTEPCAAAAVLDTLAAATAMKAAAVDRPNGSARTLHWSFSGAQLAARTVSAAGAVPPVRMPSFLQPSIPYSE